jgi:hypothetical protein
MATLANGTIRQTIDKQAGHGPYLWAVVWHNKRWMDAGITDTIEVSVFSFWDDAVEMRDRLQANGHVAQIDLATDNTRKAE